MSFKPGKSVGAMAAAMGIGAVVLIGLAAGRTASAEGDPAARGGQVQLNTTLADFFEPGTQPIQAGDPFVPVFSAVGCRNCHGNFFNNGLPLEGEPLRNWAGSMMGQTIRDPIFQAALTIANQDANFGGDLCLRCHAPGAWVTGRSTPTDMSAFVDPSDFEGVTCHACHRFVDPVYKPGVSPLIDFGVLRDLETRGEMLPTQVGNAQFVFDMDDRRRGPFNDLANPLIHGVPAVFSPFHQTAEFCGQCHDVSNPAFERQPDGTYELGALDAPHATLLKEDMVPEQRTYSEWLHSDFGNGGVQMNGRFGGNHPTGVMETCQDCHMPDVESPGCVINGFPARPNMPQHALSGANTWVLKAVRDLYDDFETNLSDETLADGLARVQEMHTNASDMDLSHDGVDLNVRVTNMTGHKLPTGYPEGRRMWLNVRFFDENSQLVAEHGAYDEVTATLNEGDTKIYEMKLGLTDSVAQAVGLPSGESQHVLLFNEVLKDNRIPPMGFTNVNFEAIQSAPIGAAYADGQHWDDTMFAIPAGAETASVTLFYQTTSKRYIEFLRDANVTNNLGQVAYDQWELHGKSEPAVMDQVLISFVSGISPADLNGDGQIGAADFAILLGSWGPCPPAPTPCAADLDSDGTVGSSDLAVLLGLWGT